MEIHHTSTFIKASSVFRVSSLLAEDDVANNFLAPSIFNLHEKNENLKKTSERLSSVHSTPKFRAKAMSHRKDIDIQCHFLFRPRFARNGCEIHYKGKSLLVDVNRP